MGLLFASFVQVRWHSQRADRLGFGSHDIRSSYLLFYPLLCYGKPPAFVC